MLKRVLIPLDGSALAEQVLPVATRLIEGIDAEITLFAVGQVPKATRRRTRVRRPTPLASAPGSFPRGMIAGDIPSYAETKDQAVERVEHDLREYLESVAHKLRDLGHSAETAVHLGNPAREIVAFAKKGGFDVIMMATHGRSGLSEALQGSVTAAVVRSGAAPVMVVRPGPSGAAKRRHKASTGAGSEA